MTIQEAIKSGKPFKRKDWEDIWYIREKASGRLVDDSNPDGTWFTSADILATDWEVKP